MTMKNLVMPTALRTGNRPENPKTEALEQVEPTLAMHNLPYQTALGRPYSIDQLVQNSTLGSFPSFAVGQTFKVPTTAKLAQVDLWAEARVIDNLPSPSDTAVAIYATADNLPTGSPLAVSDIVKIAVVGGMHRFNFPTPATLTAETTYALVVTLAGTNEINVGLAWGDPFADEGAIEGSPGHMVSKTGFDLTFKAFFTAVSPEPIAAEPSGWLEERLVKKYYYSWLDQGKQRKRYVSVKKVGAVTQMISDRCAVEEILALLKVKSSRSRL